jgi:hypothetical protein
VSRWTSEGARSSAVLAALLLGCLARTREGEAWLVDRTRAVGLDHERVPEAGYLTLADRMMGGVCVLDLDGAPPLDLFFAGRRSGTRLVRAAPGPRYADASALLDLEGVDALGCLAADLDGDDDDDLVVSARGGVVLFTRHAEGFQRTALFTGTPGALYAGIAAGDLDGDGDLDLVVAGFVDEDGAPTTCEGPVPCPLALTETPAIASLLLVQEAGGFVERAAELAPDLARAEPTLVVLVVDLDGDGAPEILVGNDLGARFPDRVLSRSEAGYADQARARGLSTNGRGHGMDTMGIAIGDVDGRGTLDLAVSDFTGTPTALFLCDEGGLCADRGAALGLLRTEETFRWGNALADLDLDGALDLVEATGHVYTEAEGAAFGARIEHAQPPNLHAGLGDGSFAQVVPAEGSALLRRYEARGLAVLDADDDGLLDVVMATSRGAPAFLANVSDRRGHWLRIALRGGAPNTDGVGARVEIEDGLRTHVRMRLAGEGYLGSFDPRLHVGVAGSSVRVRVRWPSGAVSTVDSDVDRELIVIEPR